MVDPTTFVTFYNNIHFESLLMSRIERFLLSILGHVYMRKASNENHALVKTLTLLHATFPSRVILHTYKSQTVLSACTAVSSEFGVW